MKMLIFAALALAANPLHAQSDSTAAEPTRWETTWVGSLNGSQAQYHNWAQGGVNQVAVTAGTRFQTRYSHERYVYEFNSSLRYGRARINGNESRKTDDEIAFRNQISRKFDDPRFSLIGQLNFLTQFDLGYDKSYTNVVSKFMAPGYLTQTVGFAYTPVKDTQLDAGISLKQTFMADTTLSTRYGLMPGDGFRNEGGLSLGAKTTWHVVENVSYAGRLETFTNFLRPVSSTVVKFNNDLVGKINSNLSANINFAIIYDDNVTRELQVKQVLSVGFNYTFL